MLIGWRSKILGLNFILWNHSVELRHLIFCDASPIYKVKIIDRKKIRFKKVSSKVTTFVNEKFFTENFEEAN
jgi:hypothetical protein